MKNFKSTLLLTGTFFILGTLSTFGQEYNKIYHEEYVPDNNTLLSIENAYGDVVLQNWDKNEIIIDVIVTIEHKNEDKAKELLENITVNFSKEDNIISAKTVIDKLSRSGSWFNFSGTDEKFQVDYTVNLPRALDVKVYNKYGDIFANHLSGHVDLHVKYGNITANKLTRGNKKPLNQLTMGYSNGSVSEANWLKINMKYSKLNIDASQALVSITKYSKLFLNKGSSVVAEAKYDTYNIGNLSNFVTVAKYCNFRFDEITKKIDVTLQYTDFRVDEVPAGFESIQVESSYGDIKINIEENASYHLKGYAKYAGIDHPSSGKLSRIKENTSLSVEGWVGSMKGADSEIVINTKYGNVKLTD
ncbi:MAG: DUF4097 family beta strand repeat-containing protein [Bacteroidota bacterium]